MSGQPQNEKSLQAFGHGTHPTSQPTRKSAWQPDVSLTPDAADEQRTNQPTNHPTNQPTEAAQNNQQTSKQTRKGGREGRGRERRGGGDGTHTRTTQRTTKPTKANKKHTHTKTPWATKQPTPEEGRGPPLGRILVPRWTSQSRHSVRWEPPGRQTTLSRICTQSMTLRRSLAIFWRLQAAYCFGIRR